MLLEKIPIYCILFELSFCHYNLPVIIQQKCNRNGLLGCCSSTIIICNIQFAIHVLDVLTLEYVSNIINV